MAGKLSVCCLTRGPTARVAAQLALLRDVAAEIVVAVDASVETALIRPLEDIADVLVRYPYAEPVDRPVGWVHALCTADWILWVDDDEVPSAALVSELPRLVDAPDVTHCFVPRRTLWGDSRTCLACPPWVPDFQLRLVQNDRRLLWFPGITHWPIQAVGPHRYLQEPLYHLDLLLNPLERRREKVRRYERAVPGRRVAGLPMNDAFFLPEHHASLQTAPVPDADAPTLARLLSLDPWPEPSPSATALRTATREEIDAHWHGAPAEEALYRGRLTVVDSLDPFVVGEERGVTVKVENLGSHTWPWGPLGWPEVRIAYRWLTEKGSPLVSEGLRTPLPHALARGGSCLIPANVIAPDVAGVHLLVLDLLHEHARWFGCGVSARVEVLPAQRVAIAAVDERLAADAAAVLTELAPRVVPVLLAADPAAAEARLGYGAAHGARGYLLAADSERPAGRLRLVARAGALAADAALRRAHRQPRFAGEPGRVFLDGLEHAHALLVIEDSAAGRREAWQRSAAVAAARTLGLPVVVARDASTGDRLRDAVRAVLAAVDS